jgi:hypothetical protein
MDIHKTDGQSNRLTGGLIGRKTDGWIEREGGIGRWMNFIKFHVCKHRLVDRWIDSQ